MGGSGDWFVRSGHLGGSGRDEAGPWRRPHWRVAGPLEAEGRVQRPLPGVAGHTAAASTRLYILDTDWWTRLMVDTARGGHGLWPQGGRAGSTGVDCGASGHHHRCGDKWAGCLPGPWVASRGRASRRAQRVAGLPRAASVWASARGRRSRELSRSSLRLRPRAEMRTRPAQPQRALPGSRCPGRRPPAPAERSGSALSLRQALQDRREDASHRLSPARSLQSRGPSPHAGHRARRAPR